MNALKKELQTKATNGQWKIGLSNAQIDQTTLQLKT